ncbi:MAG: alpha/beta hydrolase [Phycisphaerae bacterium]
MKSGIVAGLLAVVIAGMSTVRAEEAATLPAPIPVALWAHGVPNAAANPGAERDDGERVWNVSVPGMLVYLPEQKGSEKHMAIVFCPGGGYTHLTRLEGADGFARTFLPKGVAVVSLKYRLKPASTDVERDARDDAMQAIRIVRAHAEEWHIDPQRIGLAGASAGANATLKVASESDRGNAAASDPVDRESGRPDFVCMLSPWPDKHALSDYPIGKGAPPAFIASARDDRTAPTTFAEGIAAAYEKAGVPHRFWQIDTGGHGAFTIGGTGEGAHWVEQFWPWVQGVAAGK